MTQPCQYNDLVWEFDPDLESVARYVRGGYHPVHLGDMFKSDQATYRVVNKLGWGSFSTVWLAMMVIDGQETTESRFVALKICVGDFDAKTELAVHSRLDLARKQQETHVLQLLDSLSFQGPNGMHVVLVHDVVGNLNDTLPVGLRNLPLRVNRQLCRQLVEGVKFLHDNGVVHGDLYYKNVGLCLPKFNDHSPKEILQYFQHPDVHLLLPRQPLVRPGSLPLYQIPAIEVGFEYRKREVSFTPSSLIVKILDLGNATIVGEDPHPCCLPVHVSAPELIFDLVTTFKKSPSTRESDIWSLACLLHEMVLGALFHTDEADMYLLKTMVQLCGEIPPEWRRIPDLADEPASKEIANVEWKTRTSSTLNDAEIGEFIVLIRWMLKIDPKERPTAEEVLKHPWFSAEQDAEILSTDTWEDLRGPVPGDSGEFMAMMASLISRPDSGKRI